MSGESGRRARRLGRAWLSLVGQGLLLPIAPTRARLRRVLTAGEMLGAGLPPIRPETLLSSGSVDDRQSLILTALPAAEHNCSLLELAMLGICTLAFRPGRVFEIGTFDGRSALAMACNLPPDGILFTLNLPPTHGAGRYDERLAGTVESGHRWRGHPRSDAIHQLFGNSLDFDFSPYAPSQLIFIDGGHGESIVRSDTEHCLRIVDRRNGLILWHDATRYGVRPTLRKLAHDWPIRLIEGTTLAVLRFAGGVPVDLGY